MAARWIYRLTPAAEIDLEDIWVYTMKRWSLKQADSYHSNIVDAFGGLAAGVKTGRPVDIRDGYWKYAVGSHVVFYRSIGNGIEVIRVLHQRMDVSKNI